MAADILLFSPRTTAGVSQNSSAGVKNSLVQVFSGEKMEGDSYKPPGSASGDPGLSQFPGIPVAELC